MITLIKKIIIGGNNEHPTDSTHIPTRHIPD
jgi:hypothetical protein